MEELCAALSSESSDQTEHLEDCDNESSSSQEDLMSIPQEAASVTQGKTTMRLQAFIGNQQVLILIDSGSSSNFISSSLVQRLNCSIKPAPKATVTIANGQQMISDSYVPSLQWSVNGAVFTTDARVLLLPYYDMILGMEWLDQYSPMWVD